ncbi:hypothetical protein PCASD_04395 [Puccinia coronata f. sp. avenae]|uniref:Uncharacterized protein n=1 Tax=Puccinia coronata f. sp. avenae TaxID=200324 RepID=A0A2N5SZ94_9BASI|nr:hypothetical protein PCASD_23788 [Puccinia coronata f. sp. avenae]PLW47423.1 hypothetical protein PCASD_04395 [Puccinia coronata f. sp. avenae]
MVTITVIITTLILVAYQLFNELIKSISLPISGQVTLLSNTIFNNSRQSNNQQQASQATPAIPPPNSQVLPNKTLKKRAAPRVQAHEQLGECSHLLIVLVYSFTNVFIPSSIRKIIPKTSQYYHCWQRTIWLVWLPQLALSAASQLRPTHVDAIVVA